MTKIKKKCFILKHKWETVSFSTHSIQKYNRRGNTKGIISFKICNKCMKHEIGFLTFDGEGQEKEFKESARETDGLAEIMLQWISGVDNPNIKYVFQCLTINNPNYLQNYHKDVLLHPLKDIYSKYKYADDQHIQDAIKEVDNAIESLCTLVKLKSNL